MSGSLYGRFLLSTCGHLLCLQERRAVAKAEKLEKMRKGEPSGPKKSAEQKAVGKAFIKSLVVDSEYMGKDYDQFTNWLGAADAE